MTWEETPALKLHKYETLGPFHLGANTPTEGASQLALVMKNPPTNAGDIRDAGSIPGSGRSPGGGYATHSSILAWRIPWTEDPDGLQSMESQSQKRLKRLSTHTSTPTDIAVMRGIGITLPEVTENQ